MRYTPLCQAAKGLSEWRYCDEGADKPTQALNERDLRPDEQRFLQKVREGKVQRWKQRKKPKTRR